MSRLKKPADQANSLLLSSNEKVMHYLQNSKRCPPLNSFISLQASSANSAFPFEHRHRSCSENDSISTSSSSSSVLDEPPRSRLSTQSSLSDPVALGCLNSSNFSSEEEFDFNMAFEQVSDDDEDPSVYRNNADAVTLQDEMILDNRLNDFDESLSPPTPCTVASTETANSCQRLYDSTNTLCSGGRFSSLADEESNDEDEEEEEEEDQTAGLGVRSSSFSALRLGNQKATLVETPSKKIVRFADMMGLDLESVRYMSPPDQTASPLLQDSVRMQLGQFRLGKHLLDLPNVARRTPPSPSKKQFNLVSRNFTSRTNITPMIYNQQVLLECLYTKDAAAFGTIRVHNCAYEKRLFIRLSDDEWTTSRDVEARHSMTYPHDNTDSFTFEISLSNANDDAKRILFAVCYQTSHDSFWDNNQGWNYVLDVLEKR